MYVVAVLLHQNYSVIPATTALSKKFSRGYDDTYQQYFFSGYMTLQLALEAALVEVADQAGYLVPQYSDPASVGAGAYPAKRGDFGSLVTAPMPVQSLYSNPFYGNSGPFVGLILCLCLLYPVSRLIKVLVEDKESRRRETLKMMGMADWVHPASYAITYFVEFTFIAIVQTLLMKDSVMSHSSPALMFVFFWFFALSMMCLALSLIHI